MTLLYTSPEFLEHETGQHPERPARLAAITRQLTDLGLLERCRLPDWMPATPRDMERVHPREYLRSIELAASMGGGQLDADTVVCPASYRVGLLAAGAVCDAVRRVVRGEDRQALCLVRPPGHHALAEEAMGFCLFGNVALGARVALDECKLDKVLIVDWDVHHGNGTQAIFYTDPQVGFLSIHRWPFYPGTGREDETGSHAALGTKVNLPVPFGISRADYLACFRNGLEKLADHIKPELVLISAGFDAHRLDPVGSLRLETEDFIPLTEIVQQIAAVHAQGRLVSVLEGGYDLQALGDSVGVHLETLLKLDPNTTSAASPGSV